MADLKPKEFADALYSSYLARDFFAKVLPGAIVVSALLYPVVVARGIDWAKFENIPVLAWLFIYGICWIVGFAIQALGEVIGILRAYPSDEKDDVKILERGIQFHASEPPEPDRVQRERFVVVKEATGNASVAAYLALLIVLIPSADPTWQFTFFGVLSISGIAALYIFHRINRCRQRDHEIKVIARRRVEPINPPDAAR